MGIIFSIALLLSAFIGSRMASAAIIDPNDLNALQDLALLRYLLQRSTYAYMEIMLVTIIFILILEGKIKRSAR